MSSPSSQFFVDSVLSKVPVWMTRSNGLKFLRALIIWADITVQILFEALYARFPGVGTATALAYISRDRLMLRGMSDTDQTFAARQPLWLDRWRLAGTQLGIARAIQDYCTGSPRVKVVSRRGHMTDLAAGGATWTTSDVTWNWDGTSHAFRAGYWSELFVIVYTPPWPISDAIDTSSGATAGLGIGTKSPRVDVDAIRYLLDTWKGAHTYVRALIFCYDATLFDPSTPATMPDGTWGDWAYNGSLSGRGLKEQANKIRTWEPQRDPNGGY